MFGDKHMARVVAAASRAHGSGGTAASTGGGGTEEVSKLNFQFLESRKWT